MNCLLFSALIANCISKKIYFYSSIKPNCSRLFSRIFRLDFFTWKGFLICTSNSSRMSLFVTSAGKNCWKRSKKCGKRRRKNWEKCEKMWFIKFIGVWRATKKKILQANHSTSASYRLSHQQIFLSTPGNLMKSKEKKMLKRLFNFIPKKKHFPFHAPRHSRRLY